MKAEEEEAGEMDLWLRALEALTENSGSVSITHTSAALVSVVLVLGNWIPSSSLLRHQIHTWCTHVLTDRTLININH